jgi:hypothetical protein
MGSFRRWFFLLLIVALATVAFLLVRTGRSEPSGPPVANCPGPDRFGYLCEVGANITYVDASQDTLLYADDAVVELTLPFSFSFYGQEYNLVRASSNGNIQFSTENGSFFNVCIWPDPASTMGEMIAPFWDDLDLTFEGILETEVVGVSPDRAFVIEWDDVPFYGNSDERVTFEIQLFESGEIAFLYESVITQENPRGSSATIGIQSASQGLGLQLSCNQFSVVDNEVIRFYREGIEEEALLNRQTTRPPLPQSRQIEGDLKGQLGELINLLNRRGVDGLDSYRATVRSKSDSQDFDWRWADLDGDEDQELFVLWSGPRGEPRSAQAAVLSQLEEQNWTVEFTIWPLARSNPAESLEIFELTDVTGEKVLDVVLSSELGSLVGVLTASNKDYEFSLLQDRCSGKLLIESPENGESDWLIRSDCEGKPKAYRWDGENFVLTK